MEQVYGDPHFMVSSIGQEKFWYHFFEQSSKKFIKNKIHKLLIEKHKEMAFLVRHGNKLSKAPNSNVEIIKEFWKVLQKLIWTKFKIYFALKLKKEPVCFDYNPPPGSTLMLLSDPTSSLLVRGQFFAVYFSKIKNILRANFGRNRTSE